MLKVLADPTKLLFNPKVFTFQDLALWFQFEQIKDGKIYDWSGNRFNGDVIDATPIYSKLGSAFRFDGVNDYIAIPNVVLIKPSFTILVWVKSIPSTWNTPGWIASSRVPNGFIIHPKPDVKTVTMYVFDRDGVYNLIGEVTPEVITEWHQYGLAYDAIKKRAYIIFDLTINEYTLDIVRVEDTIPLWIGRDYEFPNRFGYGEIAFIQIYNRVLEAAEIKRLYKPGILLCLKL